MTLPDVLYHCAPNILGRGSVIEPGNWGRLVRLYEVQRGEFNGTGISEMCLELARLAYAPQATSRLNACFALEGLDEAIAFRNKHQPRALIYKVRPCGGYDSSRVHIGSYDVAMAEFAGRYLEPSLGRFRDYWTVNYDQAREVILPCALQVIEPAE